MTKEEAIGLLRVMPKELQIEGDSIMLANWFFAMVEGADALEKQIPKKPILRERQSIIHVNKGNKPHEWINQNYKDWCCPICDNGVGEQYVPRNHNQRKLDYCWKCGQKIDWDSELNE